MQYRAQNESWNYERNNRKICWKLQSRKDIEEHWFGQCNSKKTKHFPIKHLSNQQQLSQMSKSHLQNKQLKLLFAPTTSYAQFHSG